jgi:dTDP-4-dehydrorhamnose 3,5-epimerase
MIEGVVFKELVTHTDERGFFREIIRVTDVFFREGFGQWSHSLMHPGTAKAWHIHQRQTDWWYVGLGTLKVALYDTRADSPTAGELMEFLMGDHQPAQVVRIPPGVAHGCKALTGPTHLFYVTSHTYDPKDEGRIPHDDPEIDYDWESLPAIK